ncbi:hypothetical protein JB92DRAFT_2948320 [Gautieria morchelliformis]|nr:hypothetical protein JB92DRAFT_2948320 [Gautieria morchelliformis]
MPRLNHHHHPHRPSHLHPQSLPSTSSNHGSQPPHPYAQPPSQPQPHDSRARGTTPAIDMHPDAMLLDSLSPLPRPNPYGEAHVFLIAQPALPHSPRQSAMPRGASSTYRLAPGDERGLYEQFAGKRLEVWMKARVLGTIEVGRGRAVDRGRASGGVKDHRGRWTSKDRMNDATWKSYMSALRQSSLMCVKMTHLHGLGAVSAPVNLNVGGYGDTRPFYLLLVACPVRRAKRPYEETIVFQHGAQRPGNRDIVHSAYRL